jgi:hypothetical protein
MKGRLRTAPILDGKLIEVNLDWREDPSSGRDASRNIRSDNATS